MKIQQLINNELVLGDGPSEKIINPFNSEIIIEIPQSSNEQVELAVQSAKSAFSAWSRTTPADRSAMLLKVADMIEQKAEEIARIESLNCGKPYHLVLNDEIPGVADVFRFNAAACRTMRGSAAGEYLEGFTSMIRRDPIGVIGSIAPWNYPLMMAAWKVGPALVTGNSLILKPAEQSPLTAIRMAELLAEAGLPEGVFNVLPGDGTTGKALALHNDVDCVAFTGSGEVGKKILEEVYQDDFFNVISVEPILLRGENIDNPTIIPGFQRAEEKAVKAIQKHSMKIQNIQKNPLIDDSYILLGKACINTISNELKNEPTIPKNRATPESVKATGNPVISTPKSETNIKTIKISCSNISFYFFLSFFYLIISFKVIIKLIK